MTSLYDRGSICFAVSCNYPRRPGPPRNIGPVHTVNRDSGPFTGTSSVHWLSKTFRRSVDLLLPKIDSLSPQVCVRFYWRGEQRLPLSSRYTFTAPKPWVDYLNLRVGSVSRQTRSWTDVESQIIYLLPSSSTLINCNPEKILGPWNDKSRSEWNHTSGECSTNILNYFIVSNSWIVVFGSSIYTNIDNIHSRVIYLLFRLRSFGVSSLRLGWPIKVSGIRVGVFL